MAKTKPAEEDARTQRQKFIEAAREIGAAENKDTFRRNVRKVVTAPVGKPKKASRKPKE
jgi:hypothetical protein